MSNLKPSQFMPPFKRFCCSIGMIPSSYKVSLTYEEQLLWLCDFIEKEIIPVVNANGEAVKELQELFILLKDFVEHYFDNLDVQEEINKKLDEMAEDGTLTNILSNYTNLIRIFNTITDMIADDSITLNQHIKCYGLININDGLGGEFLINDNIGIKLNNGLYAKFLNDYQNNYYNEISFTKERFFDTDCYFTTIPKFDKNNNLIPLFVAKQDYPSQSPLKYSQDNNTSLTINASLSILNKLGGKGGIPIIIGDNIVLNDNSLYNVEGIPDNCLYIGITSDRTIKEFQVNNTTLEILQSENCENVFNVYYKLIDNYQKLDLSGVITNEDTVVNNPNPRQVFALKEDGTIIIMTCDGRNSDNIGLTSEQLQTILIGKGVINAWNMDGGGSSSTSIKGSKINRNIDNNGTTDRVIPYTLNIKRNIINKNIADSFSHSGINKQLIIQEILPLIPSSNNINRKNLNNYFGKLFFGTGNNCINSPLNSVSGYLINFTNTIEDENRFKWNTQLWCDRNNNNLYLRNMVEGVWNDWQLISSNSLSDIIPENASYTLSSTDTYEQIPLNFINNFNYNDVILNEDGTFSFINSDNINKLLFVQLGFKGSSGNKFIKLQKNNSDVVFQSNYIDDNSSNDLNQLILIAPLVISSSNDKFKLLAYGNENDVIQRCHLYTY